MSLRESCKESNKDVQKAEMRSEVRTGNYKTLPVGSKVEGCYGLSTELATLPSNIVRVVE